jgi:hypothetical protein
MRRNCSDYFQILKYEALDLRNSSRTALLGSLY